MLQQSLTGGTQQQTGEATASTRAYNHYIMVEAGLGQRTDGRAGDDLLIDLQVRMGLLQGLDTHLKVFLVGFHDRVFAINALQVRHSGHHIQLGTPDGREVGGDLQGLQTPLGFVGTDSHLGDGVVQVHQVTVIIGVRHHHNRAVCICRQRRRRGAQQTLGQASLAAVADNDEVVVAR